MYIFDFQVVNNDTFEGNYTFTIVKNSLPLDLTGATIKADFRISTNHDPAFTMTTESTPQTVEITDPTAGKFKFSKQIISAKPCNYQYDVQITLSTGEIFTYLKGTLTVLQDITQ